jgi:hypothetical protein
MFDVMPTIDANTAATPKSLGSKSRATIGVVSNAIAAANDLPDIMVATWPTNSAYLPRYIANRIMGKPR